MLHTTQLYCFSPTGGTKKAGEIFCKGISQNIKIVNICTQANIPEQPSSDLIVLAAPVYGGRIPALAVNKFAQLDGAGKKAVTVAVYGTRAYEDALLELNDIATKCGFEIIASAALIAEHSIVREVGKGRPDQQDEEDILVFAKKVLEKLESGNGDPILVPGNYPYKDGMNTSASPISIPECTKCGYCSSICPTGAIEVSDNAVITEVEKCILCMACVAGCPTNARIIPPPMQKAMDEKLGALKDIRRENEYFL